MPIRTRFNFKPISDKEFYSLDYQIMGLVFEIHKEFGPFCDEKIYKVELAERCQKKVWAQYNWKNPFMFLARIFQKTIIWTY